MICICVYNKNTPVRNVNVQKLCIGNTLTQQLVDTMTKESLKICLTKNPILHRYGGLSVGGQLPILDVDPEMIQNIFSQLGRMMNITGVLYCVLHINDHEILMRGT